MSFCLPSSDSLYQGHQAGHLGGADMNPEVTPRRSPILEHEEGQEGQSVLVRYTHSEESLVSGQEEDMTSLLDETVSQASTELHMEKEDIFTQGLVDQFMSQHEELEEDISMYEESSLQHKLANYPRQYYVIALAEEEEDLTAEFAEEQESCNNSIDDVVDTVKERTMTVLEEEKATVDSEDNDQVNQISSELHMEDEVACVRFVVTNAINDAVSVVEAEEEAKLNKTAKNIISDVFSELKVEDEVAFGRFVDEFVTSVINNAMSIVRAEEEAKLDRAARNIITDVFSKIQKEEEAVCVRFVNDFVRSVIGDAVSFVGTEEEAKVDRAAKNIISDVFSKLQMEEAACARYTEEFVTSVIDNAVSLVEAEMEAKLRRAAKDIITDVFSKLQDEMSIMRFVDESITSVIDNVAFIIEAEMEAKLDRGVENIVNDVFSKLEIEENISCDKFIDDFISNILSDPDVISQNVKDSLGPKETQAESRSVESDHIRQPRTKPLSSASTPVASEPVLVGHHKSVVILGTSVPNVRGLEISVTAISEAGQGRSLAPGQAAASEILQREKDQVPHPRRRSAGDVARLVFRTLSRPFRRRRRQRQVRDAKSPGGPEAVLGLNVEVQDLDLGSTRQKPRTDPSSKDPGDVDRTTPTNPTKGLGLGSPQIHHKPKADSSSKDHGGTETQGPTNGIEGPDQGSTNKTHHKELRSNPSYIDPGGITPIGPTIGLGTGEASQEEVDPAHRPMKRTRTQRLLRGIGRSLTRLGRPLVACFGGG